MKIECSICLDGLTPPNNLPISAAQCGHLFHKDCINGWIRNVGNCPQCRAPCEIKQLREIFFNNFADRRQSDVFNSTVVRDMNELQDQILTEQDTLIETNKELKAENARLRAELDQRELEASQMRIQLELLAERTSHMSLKG